MLTEGTTQLTAASVPATAGASAQLIGLNTERNGLLISLDSAATQPVYLLLGTGTASAANFNVCLAAGQAWNGLISGVLWLGAIQFFSAAGGKVGISET